MFNSSSSRPEISAFEFILLLCSKLALKGKTVLRQESLVNILFKYAQKDKYKFLFEDIAFKNSQDSVTSLDIENSLSELQNFGAIGRLNPAYEKIIIYISPDEASNFLEGKNDKIQDALNAICEGI